ncbi:CAP domain-containing protein [Apilactobacillus kunkeei]|uniref:CAP domain-containing protein n=1 Tax=Apilactobacillus kunkeei TaxID=148814 RepID=UPI00200A9538|nr:CAP domain-containing protein [Apilactobacillus kunkeei]MCK8620235.1 CAP domain-containing protein [Apilactobacillus kunkeei]
MKKFLVLVMSALSIIFILNVTAKADDTSDNSFTYTEDAPAQPQKTVTIHYVNTKGQKLADDKVMTSTGNAVSAYNMDSDTLDPIWNGYVKKIRNYMPYYLYQNVDYDKLPSSITVTYIDLKTVNSKMTAYVLKDINKVRRQHKLHALKTTKDLAKRAKVRSEELFKKFDHVRPNGKSYNAKLSGYGEVIVNYPSAANFSYQGTFDGVPFLVFNNNGKGRLNLQASAYTALEQYLTVDKLHRDTILNKWAHYVAPATTFHSDTVGMNTILFKY